MSRKQDPTVAGNKDHRRHGNKEEEEEKSTTHMGKPCNFPLCCNFPQAANSSPDLASR